MLPLGKLLILRIVIGIEPANAPAASFPQTKFATTSGEREA
jgi:hypothetical protein